ncbi:nuclear apoptosis-inducing factor 1-like [Haliotis asinina]|uniref:nuclear apoptosis-inducing factor 1-like n=1 Tax=Haliotis asinina TaxID=109174 RepID=UPI00353243DA
MASLSEAPEIISSAPSDCKKRKRRKNFSTEEENIIQSMYHAEILSKTFSNEVTNKAKAAIWQRIIDEVNNQGVCCRDVEQVKEKWGNMAQKAKKTFTEYRMQQRKTGGGPPPPEMSQTTETIIEAMKDTASISGVPGGMDTEISSCGTVNMADMEAKDLVSFPTNSLQSIPTDPECCAEAPESSVDMSIESSKVPSSCHEDEVRTEKNSRKTRKTKRSHDDVLYM